MARIAQRLMDMARDLSEIAVEMNGHRTADRSTLPRGNVLLNREMYRDARDACLKRKGISPEDFPRELELELFGSELL